MKLFSVFVFIFTVDAVKQNVLRKLISQPRIFAKTLSAIEPGEAKSTASDFKTLISTGEQERQDVTDQLDAASIALDEAKKALDSATQKRSDKESEISSSEKILENLGTTLKSQQNALAKANQHKVSTGLALVSAQDKMTKENTRIDNEKKVFETVIEKVQTIKGDSVSNLQLPAHIPSLINMMTNADPKAVETLIEALNKAISEGEKVRESVKNDLETATQNDKLAGDAVANAQSLVLATETSQETEEDKLAGLKGQLPALEFMEKEAQKDHKEKTDDYSETKKVYDAEIERIDGERKTFEDAIAQLEKLDSVVVMLD